MDVSYIIGLMALVIFIYRFIVLLVPMFLKGVKDKNYKQVFNSFTLLV